MRIVVAFGAVALLAACATTSSPPAAESSKARVDRPLPTNIPPGLDMGFGVEVIAEEGHYTFDAEGKKTYTYRLTYRISSATALEHWSTISAEWTPWYQYPPELSATVTTPSGKKYELDKKSAAEVPVGTGDRRLFSDRRRLVAPLPGLEVGALVEQVTVKRDRRPFFGEGTVGRFYFGMRVPVFLSRLVLEAPEKVPLTWAIRGTDIEPDIEVEDGIRTVVFEKAPVAPQGDFERFMPSEHARYPYVAFSTAKSWQTVAARYTALAEKKLLGADVAEMTKGLDKSLGKRRLIEKLVRRLHERIRYTGIEFGRQAIVPYTPKETLGRGYGDCKDKGTLLVAMLRSLGIEAHLAILNAGYGEDALPKLPGLESFNHAIVYVPGKEPLWIDATAELTPVGEIPTTVQGRRALIASFDTTGLVEIPEHPAGFANYQEHRTVHLAPWGPARIIEVTSGRGAMQDKLRAQYASAPRLQIAEALEKYVRSSYRAARLSNFDMTEPRDLSKPFSIAIEAEDAAVATTGPREATVELRTAVLFSWLPEELRLAALAEPEDGDEERRAAANRILARKRDFVFPEPYAASVTYDIRIPPQFELDKALENRSFSLGPATVAEAYEVSPDKIVARFSIDLAKRRYSGDEIRAFVVGLYEVFDQAVGRVRLVHRGARLLGEGKTKDALEVYRGLAAASPDDAVARARFAEALLAVGLGGPARTEIAEAQRLDAGSKFVQRLAGLVYSHDLFGRRFGAGFPRDRAVAAYRRVLALDPAHHQSRFALAVVLEHDEHGERYGDVEGTKEAVELYRALPSEGLAAHQSNLLLALLHAGDFEGLEEAASIASPTDARNALLFVAVAVTESVDAAFARIEELRLTKEKQQEVYEAAATTLAHRRRYEIARAVVQRAARTASDPIAMQQRLATLSKLRRYEEHRRKDSDPISVVEKMLERMFAPDLDVAAITELFVTDGKKSSVKAQIDRIKIGFNAFWSVAKKSGLPVSMTRDNVLALTQFFSEGNDDIGYRIAGRIAGSDGPRISWWFVVKQRGKYRVRATETSLPAVGEEAMLLLARKKELAARRWLNWAKEVVDDDRGADPLAINPFLALWSPSIDDVRLGAAALQALGPRGGNVVDVLTQRRKRHRAPEVRIHIDHALVLALNEAKQHKKKVEVAERLYRQLPESEMAFGMYCGALVDAGRAKEALKLLSKRLEDRPRDTLTRTRLADLLTVTGDRERAEAVMQKGIQIGAATPTMYNNLAWLRLFTGEVDDDDVALALEANAMTRFSNEAHLHTLAALYAEVGKSREALQLVLRRMELSGRDEPSSADWYLLGRVMHDYGLYDLAKEAYGRVEVDEGRPSDSTWALTQKKLQALAKAAKKKRI